MAESASLACLLLFGIRVRCRRWRTMLGVLVLFIVITGSVAAYGGGGGAGCNMVGSSGTTAGTYTVIVTGTSGAPTSAGIVTLTEQ